MLRRIFFLVLIGMILLSSPIVSSIDLSRRPIVRIDGVEIPNLIDDIPIKVGDSFEIKLYITNERFLFSFKGEIIVYLTCVGFFQQEIGRLKNVEIKANRNEEKISMICEIDAFDANSIQEKYDIIAVLYEKKPFGGFSEKDRSSVESVNIVTEWWEKNKVFISDFNPPENWGKKNNDNEQLATATAEESDKITVNISNYAAYKFDIKVKINLIEKPPSDIPFIEGMGELKKEIGSATTTVPAGEENEEVEVICSLRTADIERKKLDVQAVLYVEIDGQWYEVDTSTIQSIYVPLSDDPWDWIKEYGPWIWVIFVAGIGTILLIAVTVRLFFPYYKIKRKELKQKVEKMEKKKKKK